MRLLWACLAAAAAGAPELVTLELPAPAEGREAWARLGVHGLHAGGGAETLETRVGRRQRESMRFARCGLLACYSPP